MLGTQQTNKGAFTEAKKACFEMPDKYQNERNYSQHKSITHTKIIYVTPRQWTLLIVHSKQLLAQN